MGEKSIGCLWISEDKNDNKYFKGNIEIEGKKISIIIMSNKFKKDKRPDYLIYKQTPKEKQQEDVVEEITNGTELPF